MNVNYYNEFDKGAAAWLRELINQKLIPFGYVDERSITEITASDVQGFTQCHFFAGIAGWSYALHLAGIPDDFPCWTGSPPCQPFSVTGKQLGQLDERHLAPTFMRLVDQCRPPVLFGEQVAASIGKHWLDDLFTELERQGYACGAAVLPAASVGAPHKRERLFFGAKRMGHSNSDEFRGESGASYRKETEGRDRQHGDVTRPSGLLPEKQSASDPHNGFWSDADWLGCRDGKFRPVEPGTFPLASGISARVGRLRGYGNAIVPQVAAEFIKAFMSC